MNLTRCYVILSQYVNYKLKLNQGKSDNYDNINANFSKQFPLQFPSWIIARKRINVIHAPLNSVWNDATSSYLLFLNAFRSLQYRFLSSWSKLNVDRVAIYISNNRRRCYVSLRRVKIEVQNLRIIFKIRFSQKKKKKKRF